MSAGPSDWQPGASIPALVTRAQLLHRVRNYFQQQNVVEVQTPLLGRCTVTDPDINSIPVPGYGYLQTSPEYFIKRLLAAGMPSCYQLGPVFRHAERGRLHNPEFTLLEWYRLDYDDQQLMSEVKVLVDMVLGAGEYRQITYWDIVAGRQGCSRSAPRAELDLAFAEGCAQLPGRYFVVDYPPDQAALARLRHTADGPAAARFELVVEGIELANGYWELLAGEEHEHRFARDNEVRAARGLGMVTPDAHFLAALAHGLPSCAGVAVGFDRLLMLAQGASHIDEVLTFPHT